MDFPLPENEAERLSALEAYAVYGTEPEAGFDDLTELAALIAGTPISMVNIVGDTKVWLKSRHGVPPGIEEVPRGGVCCGYAISRADMLVVPDTHDDNRFKALPFIATEPFLRFYAGMPLIDSGGHALGTICIMDLVPRELTFEAAEGIRRLARQTIAQLELRLKLIEVQRSQQELAAEKQRADSLILNILPNKIAAELIERGAVEPRHHPSTTILFTDFVDFTKSAAELSPRELIDDLDMYFTEFDGIIARHGLEKVKTIGDSYMCAGGLMLGRKDHAVRCCLAALEMQRFVVASNQRLAAVGQMPWHARVGLHSGSVVSGVVGRKKFSYDVWGDAVNIAARMENAGELDRVNISESTYQHVKLYFDCTPRGALDVKNKGKMTMYFLDRLKPEYSADAAGVEANERLRNTLAGTSVTWSLH
ncbi:adenylate/guanylate cyclase domain-containing protein [Rhizobium sp. BK251]|uniref:adenylate/guanylate cyclase domain-containing protein n=1 Tax=Rhizobium sp. BK251 TaxID=2512125 RepID=UPI0010E6503E|nr:adenylate/guanylate cyclase domain-containing protein [Rhizobium sp. BK251]TCL72653.1 class 3 adenylate cyclase [Rhizobium sp. BK251]